METVKVKGKITAAEPGVVHMSVIPALGRLQQEDWQFMASLGHTERHRLLEKQGRGPITGYP